MSDLAAYLAFQLGADVLTKPLSELIGIVRFRGDFRNTVRFPDSNLATEIQAAWAELYELIAETNEGYWVTSTTVTTTASTAFTALPSDAWRVHAVDRLDGADYLGLALVGIADRNWFSSTAGKPEAYRLTARGIDLFPTPDAVYTLRVTYTPVAPFLDESPRPYYNGWEEYVIYGALIRLTLNEQRTNDWQQQFEFAHARILRGASQRKQQEPEYLVLRDAWDSDLLRDERWR